MLLKFDGQMSLLGCNDGWIRGCLGCKLRVITTNHIDGNIDVARALEKTRDDFPNDDSIAIDIKPNSQSEMLFCEVLDVWGYSALGWTPLLLRLRAHWPGADASKHHRIDFDPSDDAEEVYEFMHASGTVKPGKLFGVWNPPGASSTNAVFLWPDALAYFIEYARGNGSQRTSLSYV